MGIVGRLSGSLDGSRDTKTQQDDALALLDLDENIIYLASDHVPNAPEEGFWIAHGHGHTPTPWSDESESSVVDVIEGEEDLSPYWGIDHVEAGSWLNDLTLVPDVTHSQPFVLADPPFKAPNLPASAEFLFCLFLEGDEFDVMVGDLTERYFRLLQQVGRRKADFYVYVEVARSLYHIMKRSVVKTGVMVLLGQWIRKLG